MGLHFGSAWCIPSQSLSKLQISCMGIVQQMKFKIVITKTANAGTKRSSVFFNPHMHTQQLVE